MLGLWLKSFQLAAFYGAKVKIIQLMQGSYSLHQRFLIIRRMSVQKTQVKIATFDFSCKLPPIGISSPGS
jgi:hypothetical protein